MGAIASLNSRLQKVLSWGAGRDTGVTDENSIRVVNAILLLLSLACVIESLTLLISGAPEAALFNLTALIFFGGGLALMRSGHTRVARVLVITAGNIGSFLIADALGPDSNAQLFLLFAAVTTLLFFPLKERFWIAYGVLSAIGLFLILEFREGQPLLAVPIKVEPGNLRSFRISIFLTALISIFWQMVYFIRVSRRYQENLMYATKMVALGEMAGSIAHEVNNPITVILGHAELLEERARDGRLDPEEVISKAVKIQETSLRIGAIIQGLRSFSRESLEDATAQVPLRQIVAKTLDFCRARIKAHGIELRITELQPGWSVLAREAQVSQVLLNLLNNAVDALDGHAEKWIEISARHGEEGIELIVTDSGSGIDKAVRARMFEPFYTTKPIGRGTGLGLSIAQGIMQSHRGQLIYDESSPRTRFILRFPRA